MILAVILNMTQAFTAWSVRRTSSPKPRAVLLWVGLGIASMGVAYDITCLLTSNGSNLTEDAVFASGVVFHTISGVLALLRLRTPSSGPVTVNISQSSAGQHQKIHVGRNMVITDINGRRTVVIDGKVVEANGGTNDAA